MKFTLKKCEKVRVQDKRGKVESELLFFFFTIKGISDRFNIFLCFKKNTHD